VPKVTEESLRRKERKKREKWLSDPHKTLEAWISAVGKVTE